MASCGIEQTTGSVDKTNTGRALHYVFKVGDRQKTIDFYQNILGMKILRHEEFEEGCEATCNGPYNGKWSKTMIGYGSEDDHFVLELTYNYEIGSYRLGNDLVGIFVNSDKVLKKILEIGNYETRQCGLLQITDPDGHQLMIGPGSEPKIVKVAITVNDLDKSTVYWSEILGMRIIDKNNEKKSIRLTFGVDQCQLELRQLTSGSVERGTAFGRIAFAYPECKLKEVQDKAKKVGTTVLKELVTLKTPGKADVQVVILADPNDHEICFVGDEGFRQLSAIDPDAAAALEESMKNDQSSSWFTDGKRQG